MTYKQEKKSINRSRSDMTEMMELANEENMNIVTREMEDMRKNQVKHLEMKK